MDEPRAPSFARLPSLDRLLGPPRPFPITFCMSGSPPGCGLCRGGTSSGSARQSTMALKGNLRDFSTTQLLNLINLARKTGTLQITTRGSAAQVCFKEGKLIYATLGQDGHLADMLQKVGKLTPDQARTIREHSANQTEKALGQMLINAGKISQNDVIQAARAHMLDVIY